ncbi:MAG: FAD-dependent oxidoreductase [Rubricoccaceae bacterium]
MTDVVIIGAGLAGLACARRLATEGVPFALYDAADAPGGRIRTDREDGFLLDRGFQVLLTAYPEARRVFDYDALDLRAFAPGALVRTRHGFARVSDPFREPSAALLSAAAPVGTLADKLRVLRLRQRVRAGRPEEIWFRPETSTLEALRHRYGFSERMIEQFFRPFLGGVLLDRELGTSSRAFEFYFRMFSEGAAALPAGGMQALPEQLAAALPPGTLHLNARAAAIQNGEVRFEDREAVRARAVVVATDGPEAAYLLPGLGPPASRSTLCLYWAAEAPPLEDPLLLLDGEGRGPVNNAQVLTNVAPTYAPAGQALVSATIVGNPAQSDAEAERSARAHLRSWFGPQTDAWRFLRAYRILHALPAQLSLEPPERALRLGEGRYVAGDHRRNGSINGALVAGRHAAEAVLADLGIVRPGRPNGTHAP